jgi:hypothetical protein
LEPGIFRNADLMVASMKSRIGGGPCKQDQSELATLAARRTKFGRVWKRESYVDCTIEVPSTEVQFSCNGIEIILREGLCFVRVGSFGPRNGGIEEYVSYGRYILDHHLLWDKLSAETQAGRCQSNRIRWGTNQAEGPDDINNGAQVIIPGESDHVGLVTSRIWHQLLANRLVMPTFGQGFACSTN